MHPFHPPRTFLTGDGLRIWTNPRGSPNFVVLLRGTMYTATIPRSEIDGAMKQLSAGAAPEAVLGDGTREFPLISLTHAELNTRNNTLEVTYVTGLGTARDRITFAYSQDLEEIHGIMRKTLGDHFRIAPIRFSIFRTLGAPILSALLLGMLYWAGRGIVATGSGQQRRFYWYERYLQDEVGPQRLLWIAGALGAFTLLWALWQVLTRPIGFCIRKVEE